MNNSPAVRALRLAGSSIECAIYTQPHEIRVSRRRSPQKSSSVVVERAPPVHASTQLRYEIPSFPDAATTSWSIYPPFRCFVPFIAFLFRVGSEGCSGSNAFPSVCLEVCRFDCARLFVCLVVCLFVEGDDETERVFEGVVSNCGDLVLHVLFMVGSRRRRRRLDRRPRARLPLAVEIFLDEVPRRFYAHAGCGLALCW